MTFAHEICRPPNTCRPSNDSTFVKPLRGFNITCRFKNGAEVTIPTVAVNSSLAIQHLDEHFPDQVNGFTVSYL
jgi:hypothetical protein